MIAPRKMLGLFTSAYSKNTLLRRLCSSMSGSRELLQQYRGGGVTCHKDAAAGVAVIMLNHVERKNALSGSMMLDLADIVTDLEMWKDGKGLIVYGAGGTFCSGGDLTLMKDIMDMEKGVLMSQLMQDCLTRLYHLPLLSVALLDGPALGGGAEIAVACDLRVATRDSSIGFVQSRMGVSPGWGGGARLVELVGRTRALKLLLSGQVLSPQEAHRIELVDEVIPQSQRLLENTKEWMEQYLKAAPLVGHVAKKVVLNSLKCGDLSEAMEGERALFGEVWGGAAQKHAVESKIRHK